MPFTATGDDVEVRPPTEADSTAYREAVTRSSQRLSRFAVPNPENLLAVVAAQSPTYRTFMTWARDPAGEHGLVGRVNVSNVVLGAFRSATIGYDAYDPYAGRGLFAEGLALVLGLAFADAPLGMGLHRVEANVQPTNTRSAGLVRSLGFVHEGFSREFLNLPGVDGRRDWRDHDRYAMLATDWPAMPYRHQSGRRVAVIVRASPVWDPAGLAPLLAAELAIPLFTAGPELSLPVLFELLRVSPVGGVVECRTSSAEVRIGLARARFDPAVVPVLDPVENVTRAEVTRVALEAVAAFAAIT
ncbi:MAG: GNAT family N-acetyltransferase [Terracoccus sp.]